MALKQNLILVALLLLLFATCLAALDSFPVFIDETVHIYNAEQIPNTSPLISLQIGRIFTMWWQYLLQAPFSSEPIWLARAATLILVLLGEAALLYMGKRTAGHWGLFLTWAFLIFSRYHFFFERLALADPISSAFIFVAILFAFRLRERLDYRDALLTGLSLFLAVLAKTNALPYLGILLAAVLCLRPPRPVTIRQRVQWFSIGMGSFLIPTILFEILAAIAGKAWLRATFSYIRSRSDNDVNLVQRILGNIQETIEFSIGYLHPMLFAILLLAVIIMLWRRQFYLLLVFAAPMLILWIGEPQETRYWIVPIALFGLIGAIAFAPVLERLPRLAQGIAAILILALGLFNWLPQAITTAQNPVVLDLPIADQRQYIQSDATGFGFAEIAALIPRENRPIVLGLLANCQGFRYSYFDAYEVLCQQVNPDGSDIPRLLTWVEEMSSSAQYLILEESAYFPETIDAEILALIERPANRANLRLYRISPLNDS
jgi:hypothetical protein